VDPAQNVLLTKLQPPILRSDAVGRPALTSRLSVGAGTRLVLLSAPAGYGKTTLLAEWLASDEARGPSCAWVSLDPADTDPVRFWTHVVTAVQRIVPAAGDTTLEMLGAPSPPPVESMLAGLVNELATAGADVALVLDDYHQVDGPLDSEQQRSEIARGMAFLVDHLPAGSLIVLATRADPQLPLARLRARGELVELRAGDLRLTAEEAAALLNASLHLHLDRDQAAALHGRTEGWVAGLQLAAIALRGRGRDTGAVHRFISDFAGSERFVIDYLAEEVLGGQPPAVIDFLTRTCILDRMSGSLCDALLRAGPVRSPGAPPSGQQMLDFLDATNMFVVPLDGERRWYRYHALFSDVLRARLIRFGPAGVETVSALHRAASEWFEQEDLLPEAIGHALAIPDLDRVATLVESLPQLQFVNPIQRAMKGWLEQLPDHLVRQRPRLALLEAWRRLQDGDVTGAQSLVAAAETALARAASSAGGPGDDRNTRGEIGVIKGFLELGRSAPDAGTVVAMAERATDLLDRSNATFRGMARMTLGHAELLLGHGALAEAAFEDAERFGRRSGAAHVAVMAGLYLAATQRLHGHYRTAIATVREALSWSARHRIAVSGRVGLLHVQFADLMMETGDLTAAEYHAGEGVAGAKLAGLPPMLLYSWLTMARVRHAAGDLDGALQALDEAEALRPGGARNVTAWSACRIQILLQRGDLAAAVRWAERLEPAADAGLLSAPSPGALSVAATYDCEHTRIAPAQVWLAQAEASGDQAPVRRALAHLSVQSAVAGRFGLGWLQIKVGVLESKAQYLLGDQAGAIDAVETSLSLAEPEGLVGVFLREGPSMVALLTRVRQVRARAAHPSAVASIDRLLQRMAPPPPASGTAARLVEPLTEREQEVLRLAAAGRSNAEIARAMFVGQSTVKTHINHLFATLGVTTRTQAIARARDVGLL
jgi:LuxR family maltose regulon positive regulatory protein